VLIPASWLAGGGNAIKLRKVGRMCREVAATGAVASQHTPVPKTPGVR
jgi:hypothetical protein